MVFELERLDTLGAFELPQRLVVDELTAAIAGGTGGHRHFLLNREHRWRLRMALDDLQTLNEHLLREREERPVPGLFISKEKASLSPRTHAAGKAE